MPSSKTSLPLIKSFLPVRVWLPSTLEEGSFDEVFCYVKEHRAAASSTTAPTGSTLFVANAPIVPGVNTRILLKSVLGRFGDVERVTVVENPRLSSQQESCSIDAWHECEPRFLRPISSQGRFAHVVFTSPKEMKRTWRALGDIMKAPSKPGNGAAPGVTLEKLEIQTLIDETQRIARQEVRDLQSDSDEESDEPSKKTAKGILAVAERYRARCRNMSRATLLEKCNRVMESYETAEEEDRRMREAAKNLPDEHGFITVTYAKQSVGSKRELEEGVGGRRQGAKRSRRKKKAAEGGLTDFYRFQTKESRKKDLQDLRVRFEEDLAKVKKMKEERQYRPFTT